MRRKLLIAPAVAVLALVATATPAFAQEGGAARVQVILDNIWILVAAVLVIFMQAGFALVEAGLTRAKSVSNIMMKNMMDFTVGVIAFALVGFTIAFGGGNDYFGHKGWFLDDVGVDIGRLTVPTYFIFQVAFAATAATIVSGAMAERTKFKSYLVYSVFITAIIYPVVVHWLWGGGWLNEPFGMDTGMIDFAGSTVVHSVGGWAAMMGAIALGPRIGKYGPDGKPRAIPGHSMPFAIIGVFVLLIGWFGFNPGSELAADLAVGPIAVTTLIAAAVGAVTSMITIWIVTGKPDVGMTGNGVLAGLVGITAGCASVSNWGAAFIGGIAGIIVVGSVLMFDRIRIDDPVGAISVHGVCGAWGTLAVGLFALDGGLFHGGGGDQLLAQFIGVVSVFVFVTITAGVLFFAIKATIGLRVAPEEELEGLDVLEHGAPGYAADVLVGGMGAAAGLADN